MPDHHATPGDAELDRLAQMRHNLVERMWWTVAGMAALVLPLILWRLYGQWADERNGSMLFNLIFIGLCLVALGLFALRQQIPHTVKTAVPLLLMSVAGVLNLLQFGAASMLFVLLVQSNFLISTLYSVRTGAIATVLTTIATLLAGWAFMSGALITPIDLNEYMLLPGTWLLYLLGSAVVPTLLLYSIGAYQKTVVDLLHEVQTQRDALAAKSEALHTMSQQLTAALEAAEHAAAAIGQFLAHMTHELRTPLSGVIGMLELVHKRSHDETTSRLLGVARDNAESLLVVVNDALDISRIEAGKLTLQDACFDLQEFLARSLEIFTLRAAQKGLQFERHFAPGLNPVRRGDPARLRQVLFNLVGNAMKFTHQGSVHVEISPAMPGQPDGPVLLVVSDTGMGIEPLILPHVFDPYVQASVVTQQHMGGTGLGLFICKALVETMGGHITVQSTPGVGSRFSVTLPLPAGSPTDLVQTPSSLGATTPTRHSHRLHLLLAEDTATNQVIMMEMLHAMGHHVELASNGQEALQRAGEQVFDAILMDLRMPVLDGLAATALLRQGGDASAAVLDPDIYICALTANTQQQDRDATQAAGMQDFLAKPVRQPALHAVLQRVIDYQLSRGRPLVTNTTLPPDETGSAHLDALLRLTPSSAPLTAYSQTAIEAAFQRDAAQRLAQLPALAAQGEWPQVREIAHALHGAAQAMALDTLASASAALEQACLQQDDAHKQAQTDTLLRLLQQVLEESA
jgi:signal transduction histidine kinase/CheY-like chemotaxis protein